MPRLVAETSSGWGASHPAGVERSAPWITPLTPDPSVRAAWAATSAADAARAAGWSVAQAEDIGDSVPWGTGRIADAGAIRAPWVISAQADREEAVGGAGPVLVQIGAGHVIPWGISSVADAGQRIAGTGGIAARLVAVQQTATWSKQIAMDTLTWVPWGMGRVIDGGLVIVVPAPDPDDPETFRVPILEYYYVFNTVTLHRAVDGAEIPADNLQIRIDRDSPHWSWSASIPGYARALVKRNPDPVEVVAVLNGVEVHLLVEKFRRDRRASRTGISDMVQVSGRSRSAWLSAPYSSVVIHGNSSALTSRQIADAALSINDVPIGWSLDWRVPEWLIPSGVWSHRGTPMDAITRVVEAGGGYVQAHPSAETLIALPHYPAAPWEWASVTPDLILPEDVVEVEGCELDDKPLCNVVYVEGQGSAGRRDRILRAGSAADLPAEQIVDPLATDTLMTRARGLVALAASGPQERVSLRLPVLPETGLIFPGKFLEYSAEGSTRRGIVRGLQAEWSSPELWQTVEIEVHE